MSDYLEFIVGVHCSLCGNKGVIDSRGIRTPAGFECGGLHYCICPNGRALKNGKADKLAWLERNSPQGFPEWYEKNYRRIAATSSWVERARMTWEAAQYEANIREKSDQA